MRCFQIKYYNASESSLSLSLSLLSYITLPLNPSISLQKAVLPLSKVPGHWVRKTGWCQTLCWLLFSSYQLLPHRNPVPVELEPLIDHEKPKSRFLYKIFKFFKITTLAKQKHIYLSPRFGPKITTYKLGKN